MKNNFHGLLVSSLAISLLLLTGCNSSTAVTDTGTATDVTTASPDDDIPTDTGDTTTTTDDDTPTDTTTLGALDLGNFVAGSLTVDPVIVDCTLTDGTETTCHQLVSAGAPAGSTIGPFCPKTTDSLGTDAGGLWFDGTGALYQVDGDFILNLPNVYNSDYPGDWELYDTATGIVKITDTQIACEAAAQPDVDEAYQNHCVECSIDYLDDDFALTYLIPTTPVPVDATGSSQTTVGIALNGAQIAGPAPVQDILSNITLATFDDCGGHINVHQGYHYHGSTGCSEVGTQDDGHSAMLGYAMDGYGIYGLKDSDGNETSGLDDCRGITDDVRGYHYHAGAPEGNLTIGCFHGATAVTDDAAGGPPDGGGPGGPGGPPQ